MAMKKLDVGGLAKPTKAANPSHPVVTPNDELSVLLDQFVVINPQFKTLKAQQETLSKQIGAQSKALFFSHFAGITPESSTMLVQVGDKTVKLIVKCRYSESLEDDAPLREALGEEIVDRWFRQSTKLAIDFDKVPEDSQEDFANAILTAAKELGVEGAVTAKQPITPKAGFHEARTSLLTPEQNLRLDEVLPVVAHPLMS